MTRLGELITEARNPSSEHLDELSTADLLRLMNDADQEVAAAVAAEVPNIAKAVDAIVQRIGQRIGAPAIDQIDQIGQIGGPAESGTGRLEASAKGGAPGGRPFYTGGRLFYIGAGTSGRLGVLDASECPPTFNVPPELVQGIIAGGDAALRRSIEGAEDDPAQGAADLAAHHLTAADAVVGIAASGRTPYVLGALRYARSIGALTIALSCVPDSEIAAVAEIAITPVTGPEVLTGSTRMKAGTATKLVLNSISTAVMVRTGHVYGNLMINVQPTNAKLADRARRILSAATGLDEAAAQQLLDQAGSIKTAVLMHHQNLTRQAAKDRLHQANQNLRKALEVQET